MITTHNQVNIVSRTLPETKTERVLLRARIRWIAALYISATFGLRSLILGLVLATLGPLVLLPSFADAVRVSPAMLVGSFPLLIFAAHCLDRIADADKRVKLEYLKQMGFE